MTTNDKTGTAAGTPQGGGESAGNVGEKEGFDLFGGKPRSHEDLSRELRGFLGGSEPEAESSQESGSADREDQAAGEAAEDQDGDESAERAERPDLDEADGTDERAESEGESENVDGADEDEAVANGKWPKSAIAAITEQRERRREAVRELEATRRELEELRERLDNAELQRPLAPTPENPLAFVRTEEDLSRWVRETKAVQRLIEDHFDQTLDAEGERALRKWAQKNDALDENGELNPAALKRFKRLAEDAVVEYAPTRLQQLQKERAANSIAEKHFKWWRSPETPEEKQLRSDAMQVVKDLPWLRQLPHWKLAATIYALGLRSFREEMGQNGKGSGEAQRPRLKDPKKVVAAPGKTVALPRANRNSAAVNLEELRKKAFSKGGTQEDVASYLKAELMKSLK